MIKDIIDLLSMQEHYGVSKEVDFAMGKYKIPYNWTELKRFLKRLWKSKR
jgi:hypothetical protein